jgi:hypothetical protein
MTMMPHTRLLTTWCVPLTCISLLIAIRGSGITAHAQQPSENRAEPFQRLSKHAESRGLVERFKGITTDGTIVSGLFPMRATGVSTEPVRQAADAFLASLTPAQRAKTLFPVNDV